MWPFKRERVILPDTPPQPRIRLSKVRDPSKPCCTVCGKSRMWMVWFLPLRTTPQKTYLVTLVCRRCLLEGLRVLEAALDE